MKTKLLQILLLTNLIVFSQVPTHNPLATFYGKGNYPIWTEKVKWTNVINMASYANGTTDFEKFENARDLLYSQGGGVLYYPAGSYDFSKGPFKGVNGRGLMLKSGVFIRGERPTDSIGKDGTLNLATKFVFGFDTAGFSGSKPNLVPRDWNFISITPVNGETIKDITNVGVCWINIVGGVIYFGMEKSWSPTYQLAKKPWIDKNGFKDSSWYGCAVKSTWFSRVPDGSYPMDPFIAGGKHYIGAGKGRIVFGCKLDDACVINNAMDCALLDSSWVAGANKNENLNFFGVYKFGPRIGVYGDNTIVSNNVITKSSKNFNFFQKMCTFSGGSCSSKKCASVTLSEMQFDYGKTGAIDVNKELNGWSVEDNGFLCENVIVNDNWTYNHGHKSFNVSGKWLLVKNNVAERDYLKGNTSSTTPNADDVYGLGSKTWILTMDNYFKSNAGGAGCQSDNLARGYDMAGQHGWLDNNYLTNTGSDPGNDGEGILWQSHGGISGILSFAVTNNTHVKGVGETGYIGGWAVNQIGSLIAWNTTSGWVGNASSGTLIDAAFVDNVASSVNNTGGDFISTCPSSSPSAPTNITAVFALDSSYIEINWKDAGSDEIGFRVERKLGSSGSWQTIAIRPRRSNGSTSNPQTWRDYCIATKTDMYYRVMAINCSNAASSSQVGPYRIDKVTESFASLRKELDLELVLFPNPAKDYIMVKTGIIGIKTIKLFSMDGKNLYSGDINDDNFTLDLSKLNKGIYSIVIFSKDISQSKMFIVE